MPRDEDVFFQALELTAADRDEFLQRIGQTDQTCRHRVDALLRAHQQAAGFLRVPLAAAGSRLTADTPLGRIGRYQLLEKIGEGGCGVVYLAEQQEPVRRRLALKLIKLGMDTNAVVARFEAERQALAMMDHPNIAKVFDAGASESGRPYFVMELVRGLTITKYCDQNHFTPRERIALFVQVCAALHHAHQKGIVHRDLKPSNILVSEADGAPVPKVIDFGVAKATQGRLTEHTLYTAVEQFIGTPVYMSPEQADSSGLDVDARSDIYSLGILLFELLAGQPPFDAQNFATGGVEAIRRQIREVEPPTPSSRVRTLSAADRASIAKSRSVTPGELPVLLRGDLDWIVMRCLEKDRMRRYATAQELAADLERYLTHQPVLARPRSPVYVMRKYFRRHRSALAAAGLLLAALGGGLWSWFRPVPAPPAPAVSAPSAGPAIQAQALAQRALALCTKVGFQRGDLAVAEDLARQATELDPTSAHAWGVRAWVEAAFINRNWDLGPERQQAAQTLAGHALSLDANEPEALNAQAQVLLAQGGYEAAAEEARRAIAAAPNYYRSRLLLATAFKKLGRPEEQLQAMLEAERRDPDNVLAHYDLANYYASSRADGKGPINFAAALAEHRTITRLHPFTSALLQLARLELEKGDLKAMRAALDRVSQMPLADQAEDRAVCFAALYALCDHRPEKTLAAARLTANTYFDDALVACPKAWMTGFAQLEQGHPALAQREWESAESVLRQRLHDDPDNRERYGGQLALTLALLGRKEEAARWIAPLLSAARDEMTYARANVLAQYYGALGDARQAVHYMQFPRAEWPLGILLFDPWWDKVRDTPEFRAEVERVRPFFSTPDGP